jgi:hypothetical protein
MPAPRRGEVWIVDLGMAAKVRPAVVISVPADDQDRALATLVRIRQVHGNLGSRLQYRFRFFGPACSMHRTSLPFPTPSSFGRLGCSARHNWQSSSVPCESGLAFHQAGQRPNQRFAADGGRWDDEPPRLKRRR